MKLLRCRNCHDVVVLSTRWRECECHSSGGIYINREWAAVLGPLDAYGLDNKLWAEGKAEAWKDDELGQIIYLDRLIAAGTIATRDELGRAGIKQLPGG